MADPHRNCFYYFRGPSARPEERAHHWQVEDNTTKALINVLDYSEPAVTASFVSTFAGLHVERDDDAHYYLQSTPTGLDAPERRLLAVSRLDDAPQSADEEVLPLGGARPDAAVHDPGKALVVIEVKVDLSLDLLMHDCWPLAARWEDRPTILIHVHPGAAPHTRALIEAGSDRIGAQLGIAAGDWGLFNVLRSRSVACG